MSTLTRSPPPSPCSNLMNHGRQVHHSVHLVSAAECISKLVRSWPPSASLISLNDGLQWHFQTHSFMASWLISNPDSSCPPSASLSYSMSDSKYISNVAPTDSPTASLGSLDVGLQMHPQTCSITPCKGISEFTPCRSPIASTNLLIYCHGVHL